MHSKLIHFTFFLDMLGFGNKIGGISNEESAKEFVDFMEENKKIFTIFTEIDKGRDKKLVTVINYYKFEYTFISDSIVMSFVPKEFTPHIPTELYYRHSASLFYSMVNRIIGLLTHLLTKHKILLRGGITKKYAYIKNEFVVGEGIIEAYKLESSEATYPRIILSKEVTQDSQLMEAFKFIVLNTLVKTMHFQCKALASTNVLEVRMGNEKWKPYNKPIASTYRMGNKIPI